MKQNDENDEKDKLAKTYSEIGPYLGLGFQLAASIVIMLFLGIKLDEYLESKPIFTILFSMFGGFAGIYNVIRSTINLNKKKKVE